MLLVSHTIRILTGDYHLFYKYKNTRNDNRAKKKMFRNQQKSYIYKFRYKSRFICQWDMKKSRPPLSLWRGGLSV